MVKNLLLLTIVMGASLIVACKTSYDHEEKAHAKCRTVQPDEVHACLNGRRKYD